MEIAYDEKTGKWKEYKPYASVDFMSEDDYQRFEELWKNRNLYRWIPVSEELPKDPIMMLVSCQAKNGNKSVNRAYYMDGHWHGSGSMSGVKAWMPLPEPYEGDIADE